MHTNLHNGECVFVGAKQYRVSIVEAMQCTHNHIELNNTLCILLHYLLEEGRELHGMQYAPLNVLPNADQKLGTVAGFQVCYARRTP